MRRQRLLPAAIGVPAVVAVAVACMFWWPLPQGTPELAPEVEALRSQATSFVEHQPGRGDDWSLVLGTANAETVWVHFVRIRDKRTWGCQLPTTKRWNHAGARPTLAAIRGVCPESGHFSRGLTVRQCDGS
ncbi:hypothetical protein SAMN04487766_11345 [Actinomyces ruminicola]|uniref:Uncharacterized protein n=1 Tax=Actinomyces ruminicola TaxID=332524 RepID=A0A1G9YKJ5_9ACTO|nr:hypothetical protein SAMN04487766_11345 [Actinomyces ruminicola]